MPTSSPSWFVPYVQIVRSLLSDVRHVAVFDCGGLQLANCGAAEPDGLLKRVFDAVRRIDEKPLQPGDGWRIDAAGAITYLLLVRDTTHVPVGLLTLVRPLISTLGDAPSLDAVTQTIAPATRLLARELSDLTPSASNSLQAAAFDGRWRNDLNRLRTSGAGGVQAVEPILQAVRERLGCQYVMVFIPGCGLERLIGSDSAVPAETEHIRGLIAEHLYPRMIESGSTLTINKLREGIDAQLVPFRFVLSPLKRGARVVGAMTMVNRLAARIFADADAQLLDQVSVAVYEAIGALFDEATGLLTRQAFEEHAAARLQIVSPVARCVVYGDMDRLHTINDLFGFARGDEVLRSVAQVWHERAWPHGCSISRLSGDRFVALLDNCTLNQARSWAEQVRESIHAIALPTECTGLKLSASFGVSAAGTGQTLNHALATAETACKAAKDRGRNRVELFAETDLSLMQRHDDLRVFRHLVDALDASRFRLFAQPLVPLAAPGGHTHYEILVRLLDDNNDSIAPGKFFSSATRYQLLPRLDQWVVTETIALLNAARVLFDTHKTIFWINLSGQSLAQREFADFARAAVRDSGLPAGSIGFEITENAAIGNLEPAQRFMMRLRELGCQFALDDFGTGLSSLTYLKDLPVSMLKIDGSFIRDLLRDARSESLVRAVLQVARELALHTTAECIESIDVAQHLATLGVTYGQGYALGLPGPLTELLANPSLRSPALPAPPLLVGANRLGISKSVQP